MNYIKTLSAKGLKSGDFEHQLGRVNLICGTSFSGKTSRIEAIRLALLGYVPELGRQASSTMALARNGTIEVSVEDDQGRRMERRFKRGKSAELLTHNLPPTPPVLMDPNIYFELSDAAKIQYVFSMYQLGEDYTGESIIAAVKNVRLENNTAETEAIVNDIVGLLDASDTERHDNGQAVQEWLGTEIVKLKARLKDAKATADRMTKTVQGLTFINGAELPARNFAKEIEAKRKALAEVNESIGSLTASETQYRNLQQKIEALRTERHALPVNDGPSLEDMLRQCDHVEAEIIALSQDQSWDEPFKAEVEQLMSQKVELDGAIDGHQSTLADAMNGLVEHRSNLQTLTARVAEVTKMESDLRATKAAKLCRPCCPECGTATDSMSDRIKEHYDGEIKAVKAQIEYYSTRAAEVKALLDEAEKKVASAKDADAKIDAKRKASSVIQQAIASSQTRRNQARADREHQTNLKRKQHQDIRTTWKAANDKNKRRDELTGLIAAAESELSGWDIEAIITKRTAKVQERSDIEAAVRALEAQQQDYQRQKDDERRFAQAQLENAKAQADLTVTKAVIDRLEEIQTKMVAAAFDRILQTVNAVTHGILDAPIEYRDGELGRFKGTTWIRHETFSGTEKALTYAGISLALAEAAPIRLVMIDELGRLDPDSLEKVLQRMVHLCDNGRLGQFIGCIACEGEAECEVDGVNIISL